MIVEQFLSGFHYGDAVGNSVLRFHNYLISKGIESRIVAITVDDVLERKCIKFKDYITTDRSLKIYHFAISSPLTDFFLKAKGPKVLVYHNITPEHFFYDYSPELVRSTRNGRKELKELSGSFDISVADSEFNAEELKALGFKNIKTFPIMIDINNYHTKTGGVFAERFNGDKKNILFVGRISPNKKIEDLLKFYGVFKRVTSTPARLVIAGNHKGVPNYYYSIRKISEQLELTAEDVFFTGHIPFRELVALYNVADIFLSMSEHEGFCLPLIESMIFKLPIMAYSAGAVPETLGGAGIIFSEKKMDGLSFTAEKILNDQELNKKLKDSSVRRLKEYELSSRPEKLFSFITEEI